MLFSCLLYYLNIPCNKLCNNIKHIYHFPHSTIINIQLNVRFNETSAVENLLIQVLLSSLTIQTCQGSVWTNAAQRQRQYSHPACHSPETIPVRKHTADQS